MHFNSNTIRLVVKTSMPKTEFLGFDKERNAYRMNVHAPPEKGKANREIVKFFKKKYKKDLRIISGRSSREKLVQVF